MSPWLLLIFVTLCSAQPPPANVDPASMAEGVDNIRRLTGIAAQIMELSGNIMGGGGNGGGSDYGREVRPSFHGVRNFESDNSIMSGSSQDNSIRNMARLFQEYGAGFLAQATTPTTTTTTTTRPNVFQSLMNTFLGSSVDSAPDALPPPPTPKPRQSNILGLFGSGFGQPGSAPSPPVKEREANFMGGIIDSFLPTTPPPTRQPSFLSMFGLPTATERPSSSRLGKIDLFEMFGMGPRTTTTTEAPLRALLNPGSYAGNPGDAQNIDKILNALVRSNAQPAPRSEGGAAGLISSFFG